MRSLTIDGSVKWLTAVVGLVSLAFASTTLAAPAVRQSADVVRVDNGGVVGEASLVRTNSGVSMHLASSIEGDLILLPTNVPSGESFNPGDATTTWFVVFNQPANCTVPCGEDDVINSLFGGPAPDAVVDIVFGTGHVAGNEWRAGAHLNVGDTSGSVLPLFGLAPIGLLDAMEAEVHVIVRSHGPASDLTPGQLDDALHTLLGGCTDIGGPFACGDAQAAEFPPLP